jgi:prophage endopeptidase
VKLRYLVMIVIFILSMIGGLGYSAFHYHGKYTAAQREATSAQAVTISLLTAIDLMYATTKAAHEDKQKLADEGEKRIVYIRQAVKDDECAVRAVPDAATDNLRMLENSDRTGLPAKDKP